MERRATLGIIQMFFEGSCCRLMEMKELGGERLQSAAAALMFFMISPLGAIVSRISQQEDSCTLS